MLDLSTDHPACICDLPTELIERIFSHACTDGGYTGRSLSLVSKCAHRAARTVRFRNVALSGHRQIEAFLNLLEKERVVAPIHVSNLYISTWTDGEEITKVRDGQSPRWEGLHPYLPTPIPTDPHWRVWLTLQEAVDKKIAELIYRLLLRVAPALRALSVVHSWEFRAIQFPPCFPFLTDLTFCGPPPHMPCKVSSSPLPPRLPDLRRLHIICWNASISSWTYHAPAITFLRLSDVTHSAYTLPCELQSQIGSFGQGSHPTFAPKHRFLQHIRIQPRGVPLSWLGTPDAGLDFLAKLQRVQPHPGIHLELLEDRVYRYGYWEDRIKQDWLDAIVSAPGWWVDGEVREEGDEAEIPMSEDDEDPVVTEHQLSHWAQQL
ncbi:hypothetical protein L226DRAFT_565598 [Lentinus tigrinus ALCF2SS1-7]|uniref:Uncharacterized protein n=1 Tax=Lentinus tigrinus ALCF2SS1-6 TaxID=1328759 RepID=A0A5C2SSD8_9APHY|nr:hypothetical protein L227DRAFT_569028 [Lentinus tigrinus ALCF2SS1-6]RPD80758.1 hypothetical protein L226DRAFT_565598 [Lentinus tigrinus ALCF2SS1-7]